MQLRTANKLSAYIFGNVHPVLVANALTKPVMTLMHNRKPKGQRSTQKNRIRAPSCCGWPFGQPPTPPALALLLSLTYAAHAKLDQSKHGPYE